MTILITGARGQIGSEIVLQLQQQNLPHIALDHLALDIADNEATQNIITYHKPSIVINAAAFTAVDRAENEQEKAYAVNYEGAANLASTCAKLNIPLIHLSTDYIFNGEKNSAYIETDMADPLNIYGLSKWRGEEAIRQRLDQHIILRVSWVFGINGHNFVKTMLKLLQERDEIRVVADQKGCPTYASDIAKNIIEIIKNNIITDDSPIKFTDWGTYHYCSMPATSWYEFAETIYQEAKELLLIKPDTNIIPIASKDYAIVAKRPLNSVLSCQKIFNTFGIVQPEWKIRLKDNIRSLFKKYNN